jgi:iron complex outermembrane receptor protein
MKGRKLCGEVYLLFMSVSVFGLIVTQKASAQESRNVENSQETHTTHEDRNETGDIIVTAQRREQKLSEVPLAVQAFSADQLRQANVTGTDMLSQISPSLSFASAFQAAASSISLRGVQSLSNVGGVQPSVGVVIDDVPVSRQVEAVLELADIDRIEVLSGPQGTLFGKNATAGVVNIVSKNPQPEFAGSFEGTVTYDDQQSVRSMLNVPLSSRVSARFNGYYDRMGTRFQNVGGRDQGDRDAWGVNGKLLFDLGPGSNLLLTAQYNHAWGTAGVYHVIAPVAGSLGLLQRQMLGPAIGFGVETIDQNTPTVDAYSSQSYTAKFTTPLADRLSLAAVTGYRRLKNRGVIDIDVGPIGGNLGTGLSPNPLNYPIEFLAVPNSHFDTYKYWSQEFRLSYSAPGVDIVGGFYYQNYDETRHLRTTLRSDGSRVGRTPGLKYINDYIVDLGIADDTYAFFGDATVAIAPTLKLFGGLRYTGERVRLQYYRTNWFNQDNGSFNYATMVNSAPPTGVTSFTSSKSYSDLSGRAGIQWQPQHGINFYASYNKGYKGPAVNSASSATANGALVPPEKANAFEIGAKLRLFDNRLAIDASMFKQTIDNIQQTAVLNGVQTTLISAGALKTDGFEVNIIANPTRSLTLTTGVAYNNARYSGPYRFTCGPSYTPGVGICDINGTLPLDGLPAIGIPRWKVVSSATYKREVGANLVATGRVSLEWRTPIQYTLFQDPVYTRDGNTGILNASLSVGKSDDRWQLMVFVNNITDKFHYSYLNTSATTIGNSYGTLPRDYKRYGGLKLSYAL